MFLRCDFKKDSTPICKTSVIDGCCASVSQLFLQGNISYESFLQTWVSFSLSAIFIGCHLPPASSKHTANMCIGKSLQLNKYETDPYFLQNFRSKTTICLIFHVFCKSYECEIVLICCWQNNFRFTTLTKYGNNWTNYRIALEILKKIWISLVFI